MKHLPLVLCGLLAVPDNDATGASNTLTFNAPEWNTT
jgi:hypothetical protein